MLKKGAGITSRPEQAGKRVHWDDSISAFSSRIRTGVISNLKHKEPQAFLMDCGRLFKRRIYNALKKDNALKVNATFCGEFTIVKGGRVLEEYKYFTTSNSPIYKETELDQWFDENVTEPIMIELEEFQERDSGWALKKIVNLGININKFTPQLGSSYIELPPSIKHKKACINVQNNDARCFAWTVVSALFPAEKDPQRLSKYPDFREVLKLEGIQFPMTLKQIPNFEKQNSLSVNVYKLEKSGKTFKVLPTYLTRNKKDKHVNLLMIQDKYGDGGEDAPTKFHFCWIKNLSRLVSKQLSKHDGKKHICDRCLHYFRSQDKLEKHQEDCAKINDTKIKMPEIGKNILRFKNYKNKERAPFIVYADLESVLAPTADSKRTQQHIPAAVGYYLKCSYDDSLSFYKSFRGAECMQWFADEMSQLAENVATVFWCPYDIDMTQTEEAEFQKATNCHICEQPFTSPSDKVRDHNHLIPNNNYRGPAHSAPCNLNHQDSHVIYVVFHNLGGYDAHFIIADIANRMKGSIDLLPITKEKYISFTKHIDEYPVQFRFIDSFRFMSSSLDKLASYLPEYPNLRYQFAELDEDKIGLLTRKGVMPYDYIDSFDRFEEACLPPIEAFYNTLNDTPCPRKLYQRAKQVWSNFNCQDLGEYVDLYMKTDILLLADVFEQFRSSCLKTYELDPAHYYTLPGFTWDAMLKYTGREIELITDQDMFLFVERGIRGGLSQVCSKRQAQANNKYMPNYDSDKKESYLMYFDINNQYGWAMSQHLPYGGFEWTDTNIDVTSIIDDAETGYMLEVDLEYPHHLHDLHKDIPLCPEHINPKTGKPPKSVRELTKLMATLHGKEKYIIHYRALKQALEHGLKIKKVHRVLKFNQSPWLKSYIDLNTKLRQLAKNEFEKNLFKLMNNAVFGKTMENIRKRVNVRLLTKWSGRYGAEAYISKPEFKTSTIFNENLVAVVLRKLEIYLNKPIYVGQAILDLAKTTIYDFHYGYMKNVFKDDCSVLYTDTDSLIYEITEKDPYEIIQRDCHTHFDTSDYDPNNIYKIPQVNKKVLGMMKDENNGIPMTNYVGLRSKLYATKVMVTEGDIQKKKKELRDADYDDDEIELIISNYGVTKKAKGVKYNVVRNKITFDDYIECLETYSEKCISQTIIRSEKHKVYTMNQTKIGLSSSDDKRYLIPGSNKTLPWGHYSI
nr:DNA polymerase [Rickettsia endosymbiont of Ceutorhynchus assimilis]